MLKILSLIFMVLVLILGLSFFSLNDHAVELNYYFGTAELSLPVILIASVALGALLGLTGSMRPILRLKKEIAVLKRSNQDISRDVSHARAAVKDGH